MQTLIDFIYLLYQKTIGLILCPVKYFYSLIVDEVVYQVDTLDVSAITAYTAAVTISGELGMWLDVFAVKECFAITSAAYTVRFAIRRIPFIGG